MATQEYHNEKDYNVKQYSAPSDADYSSNEVNGPVQHVKLQRQLKNRHIAMISIGGVIGTGLFLGTANSLRLGGPIGAFSCQSSSSLLSTSLQVCYWVTLSLGLSATLSWCELSRFVPHGSLILLSRFLLVK